MLIRPIGEIHEHTAGFRRDANTGHLLVGKTGRLLEFCGGGKCRNSQPKREGKGIAHKKDSPLVPEPDDQLH